MKLKSLRIKFFSIGIIASLTLALLYVMAFKLPDLKQFAKPLIIPIIKHIKVWRAGGEDLYFQQVIDDQSLTAEKLSPPNKLIETSRLPVVVKYISLPKGFPIGAGAIARINDKLVILSRTGTFYFYFKGIVSELRLPKLPNNIEKYTITSKGALNSDSLRASSIAFDELGKKLYVAYNKYEANNQNRIVVSSIIIDPITLKYTGEWSTLFESDLVDTDYGSQAGGGRVIVNQESIYVSVGYSEHPVSYKGKRVPASQSLDSSLGKIFKIDKTTRRSELLSMGHRNVQGMAFTLSGNLLASEQGPQGGDEINLIQKGSNFGWPYQSYGTDYGKYSFNSSFEVPKEFASAEPLYAFVPSMAISPLHLIENFHPAWNGDILLGSLKAQTLFRIVIRSQRVVVVEPIWIGHRIRDIAILPDNQIVLLTDDSFLIFLSVDSALFQVNSKNSGYNFEPKLARCLVCHHFETTTPVSIGPSLRSIVGRKIGGDNYEKYSDGIKKANGFWTKETLSAYLLNPESVVPGTTMPNQQLTSKEVKDIVDILAKLP
jgi:cytochrome c2